MKLLILFTLVFSFNVFGQKTIEDIKKQLKTFKDTNDRRYEIKYDKFEDRSSVRYMGDALNSGTNFVLSGQSVQLQAAFTFPGNKLEKPVNDFVLLITASGKGWEFLRNQHLFVLADEERFDLGEGARDSTITRNIIFGGLQTIEVLSFKITRAELEKFSNAKKVEIKVGERVFKLKEGVQKGFSNMLALSSI